MTCGCAQFVTVVTEKMCFVCEVDGGMEQDAMDMNLNSCPHGHSLTEITPKHLAHIAAHIS